MSVRVCNCIHCICLCMIARVQLIQCVFVCIWYIYVCMIVGVCNCTQCVCCVCMIVGVCNCTQFACCVCMNMRVCSCILYMCVYARALVQLGTTAWSACFMLFGCTANTLQFTCTFVHQITPAIHTHACLSLNKEHVAVVRTLRYTPGA